MDRHRAGLPAGAEEGEAKGRGGVWPAWRGTEGDRNRDDANEREGGEHGDNFFSPPSNGNAAPATHHQRREWELNTRPAPSDRGRKTRALLTEVRACPRSGSDGRKARDDVACGYALGESQE